MSEFTTSAGQRFRVERELPRLPWRKPQVKAVVDATIERVGKAIIFEELGLVLIGLALLFVLLVVEVALVIAIVVPLAILAVMVGVKRHDVVLREVATGRVVERRSVHGLVGGWRSSRALRATAEAKTYAQVGLQASA